MPFGPLELVIVLLIVLVILGPGKLPQVGSALGRSLREFRKGAADEPRPTPTDATTTDRRD